jgi:hypothetical protein
MQFSKYIQRELWFTSSAKTLANYLNHEGCEAQKVIKGRIFPSLPLKAQF